MQIVNVRIPRSLILAFFLGVALTPIAPDAGYVVAETRIPHRIDSAHQIANGTAELPVQIVR